eukprot:2035427-Amphidinium_carterae.1
MEIITHHHLAKGPQAEEGFKQHVEVTHAPEPGSGVPRFELLVESGRMLCRGKLQQLAANNANVGA